MLNTFAAVNALGRLASDSVKVDRSTTGLTLVVANGLVPQLVIAAEVRGERAGLAFHTLRAGMLVYVTGALVLERSRIRGGGERYLILVDSFTVVADKAEQEAAARAAEAPPAKISEPLFGHTFDEPEPV